MRLRHFAFAAIAAAIPACFASATSVLQIDINSLTVDAGGVFGGKTHTGALNISINAASTLNGIKINGGDVGFAGTLTNFMGVINLNNGAVTGGSLFVEVNGVDTYSALISGAEGAVNSQAGQGFMVDGLTFQGFFSGPTFAGVDVSSWFTSQPLIGSFLQFAFSPNASGVDNNTDIDIYILVPLPTGAGLAATGLLGLAAIRRRREIA
jgi:hypothetical protein